jgi:hypothetical protein
LRELLFGLDVGLYFEDEFLCEEGGEKGEAEDGGGKGHGLWEAGWMLVLFIG